MNEIKTYKSASGFVSENKKEVADEEKAYLFKKKVEELVEKECWSGMGKDDVVDFIIENQNELTKALK